MELPGKSPAQTASIAAEFVISITGHRDLVTDDADATRRAFARDFHRRPGPKLPGWLIQQLLHARTLGAVSANGTDDRHDLFAPIYSSRRDDHRPGRNQRQRPGGDYACDQPAT